jgi:hypothetical protein
VNDAPQESQPFRQVGTILSNSLLRGGPVSSEEGFETLGLGKQVCRVTQLRCLDGDPPEVSKMYSSRYKYRRRDRRQSWRT